MNIGVVALYCYKTVQYIKLSFNLSSVMGYLHPYQLPDLSDFELLTILFICNG